MEVIHCFVAALMALLLRKCCPHSSLFVSVNRWKSEDTKFRLYTLCDKIVQTKLAMRSTVFKLICGLALLLYKREVIFFYSLTLEVQATVGLDLLMSFPTPAILWSVLSFLNVTAVYGCLESWLFFMLLLPPLKHTTHYLSVLTSTVCSP